jgi:hypothetical protein
MNIPIFYYDHWVDQMNMPMFYYDHWVDQMNMPMFYYDHWEHSFRVAAMDNISLAIKKSAQIPAKITNIQKNK